MTHEFKLMGPRELGSYPNTPEEKADEEFRKRLMSEPIDLLEKCQRPHSGIVNWDDVDERDMCFQFARDIRTMLYSTIPGKGIPLTKDELKKLPTCPAVYWLNAPLDGNFTRWTWVYVGKAADLRKRWEDHHRYEQAREWGCRLDWWEVDRGTEALIEAALIYYVKPAWNER